MASPSGIFVTRACNHPKPRCVVFSFRRVNLQAVRSPMSGQHIFKTRSNSRSESVHASAICFSLSFNCLYGFMHPSREENPFLASFYLELVFGNLRPPLAPIQENHSNRTFFRTFCCLRYVFPCQKRKLFSNYNEIPPPAQRLFGLIPKYTC